MDDPDPETPSLATVALVLGIFSIIACLGPITGVPAIVLGRRAERGATAADGTAGRALATGAVVTGAIGTLLWVLALVGVLVAVTLGAMSGP
jgi:hypothetical protein